MVEIRRSPPVVYETLWNMGYSPYQLVKDFFHQQLIRTFDLTLPETKSHFTWKWMVGRRSGFLLGQPALFSWAFAVSFRGGWLIQPSRLSADSTFRDDKWQILYLEGNTSNLKQRGARWCWAIFTEQGNDVVSYTHWGKPPGFPQQKNTWLFLHVISRSVRHRNFSMFGRGQALGWWMAGNQPCFTNMFVRYLKWTYSPM